MNNNDLDDNNVVHGTPFGRNHGKCPQCGSRSVVPILYGYPTEDSINKAHRGELHMGGCMVTGDDPELSCNECGEQW